MVFVNTPTIKYILTGGITDGLGLGKAEQQLHGLPYIVVRYPRASMRNQMRSISMTRIPISVRVQPRVFGPRLMQSQVQIPFDSYPSSP